MQQHSGGSLLVAAAFDILKGVASTVTDRVPNSGLDAQGIATGAESFWNLTTAPLVEHAVRRGEGLLA